MRLQRPDINWHARLGSSPLAMASTWHSGIANQPVSHFLSNCTAFTFELFSARFRFLNGPSREWGSGTESLIPLKLADNNRPRDPHSLKTLHQCKWNWDKRKMFICMFSLLVFLVVDCRTAIALHIYEIRGRSLLLHFPCQVIEVGWSFLLRWVEIFFSSPRWTGWYVTAVTCGGGQLDVVGVW